MKAASNGNGVLLAMSTDEFVEIANQLESSALDELSSEPVRSNPDEKKPDNVHLHTLNVTATGLDNAPAKSNMLHSAVDRHSMEK